MAAFGDHVYFAANDGVHGMELWRVHRSGAPIELVQDLVPGPGSSDPQNLIVVNDRLLFQAIDPSRALLVLREVIDGEPFEGEIGIVAVGDDIELRFGAGIGDPYLLMESDDLFSWRPIEAFSGPDLNQENVRVYPLEEFGRYYRLQRN
jgi:ELWxxDGT repeat protein